MLTVTLRGFALLAKATPYGVAPYHFANRTQAEAAASKVNGRVFRFPGGRPFYVEVRK